MSRIKAGFIVMFPFLIVSLLYQHRYGLLYNHYQIRYSIASDFKYGNGMKGGFHTYKYHLGEKEYESLITNGIQLKNGKITAYGYFKSSDKYLIKYPIIAEWDGLMLTEYKLPDTTSVPPEGWDSIPQWIEDYIKEDKK